MSEAFDQTIAAAADSFFLLPGAETVTYYPRSGAGRQIKAVVSRIGDEQMAGVAGGSRPRAEVLVKNNSASGISSAELDTGGDKLEVAARQGQRPEMLRLIELLDHDAGHCNILAT
jgi:hypothetical protein